MNRSRKTVLVIEDNAFNLDMAKQLLELGQYTVLEAKDADTGMALAQARCPDLILMDIHLPHKDGYTATRQLKNNEATRHIPIVAYTALAMKEDELRAQAAGCIGTISKPIDVDTFVQTIGQYLQVSAQPQASSRYSSAQYEASFSDERAIRSLLLNLSHDLQAPLRRIQQLCALLQQSPPESLGAQNREYVSRIDSSAQHMLTLLSRELSSHSQA